MKILSVLLVLAFAQSGLAQNNIDNEKAKLAEMERQLEEKRAALKAKEEALNSSKNITEDDIVLIEKKVNEN